MSRFGGFRIALTMLATASLLACAPPAQAPTQAEHSPESDFICNSYGFKAGTESSASCVAKLDGLFEEHHRNERRCQA